MTNQTEPLIDDGGRITFRGMAMDQDDLPGLDDRRTFSVTATCVAVERQRMKDGEVRLVAKMEVEKVWEGQGPEPAEPQDPALFNEDGSKAGDWADPDTSTPQPGDADYIEPGTPLQRPTSGVADPFSTAGDE